MCLFHLWESEFNTRTGSVGPALHNGLVARVKAHAFRAVSVVVAEHAALPAAKTVEGHRHRQGHVNADHADLDLAHEFARHAAVARIDGDAVAVLVGVDQIDGSARCRVRASRTAQGRKSLPCRSIMSGVTWSNKVPPTKKPFSRPGTTQLRPSTTRVAPCSTPSAMSFSMRCLACCGDDWPHFCIRRHAVAYLQCGWCVPPVRR